VAEARKGDQLTFDPKGNAEIRNAGIDGTFTGLFWENYFGNVPSSPVFPVFQTGRVGPHPRRFTSDSISTTPQDNFLGRIYDENSVDKAGGFPVDYP
jgi:hypothetical protein